MISSLACKNILSPNHSNGRTSSVDHITPHYMAGNCTIETCGEIFMPRSRNASSNYGIGSDGRIACYVDEDDRAWTSGSSANDNRAITIECANIGDGSLTDACWNSLIELCVDICKRYGFQGVQYTGSIYHQELGYMLLTMHCWFQNTDCPGPWLVHKFSDLAREVNKRMDSPTPSIEPANNTHGGKLTVDGMAGYNTIIDMQHCLSTYEDGCISGQYKRNKDFFRGFTNVEWGGSGSPMVIALQNLIGAAPDGLWGKETSTKLQEYLVSKGYHVGSWGVDGYFGSDSVMALQKCLNDNAFVASV